MGRGGDAANRTGVNIHPSARGTLRARYGPMDALGKWNAGRAAGAVPLNLQPFHTASPDGKGGWWSHTSDEQNKMVRTMQPLGREERNVKSSFGKTCARPLSVMSTRSEMATRGEEVPYGSLPVMRERVPTAPGQFAITDRHSDWGLRTGRTFVNCVPGNKRAPTSLSFSPRGMKGLPAANMPDPRDVMRDMLMRQHNMGERYDEVTNAFRKTLQKKSERGPGKMAGITSVHTRNQTYANGQTTVFG